MPTNQIFDDLLRKGISQGKIPGKTRDARDWFRKEANKLNVSPSRVMLEGSPYSGGKDATKSAHAKYTRRLEPGTMLLYNYSAKMKKELPYWDSFPLIFVVGPAKKGHYGINLHYLPLRQRAMLMDSLHTIATDKRYDDKTKLKLNYNVLKKAGKFKLFAPCFKHYLAGHIKSKKLLIESAAWDIAMFLPIARFQKASQETVWRDSLRYSKKRK